MVMMMSKRVRGSTTGHAGRSFLPVSSTLSGHMYLWVHDRPYPNVVESRWLGLLGVSQISLGKQQQHTVHGLLGKYSITHRYSAHLMQQQQHTVHGLLGKYSITHRYSAHLMQQQQHTVNGLLGKYSITHRYSAHLMQQQQMGY